MIELQMLIRSRKSSEYFAMKILSKLQIMKTKQIDHTLNEKRILQSLKFPFVIHLITFLKDNSYLYFVLPFIAGGEMFTLLRK